MKNAGTTGLCRQKKPRAGLLGWNWPPGLSGVVPPNLQLPLHPLLIILQNIAYRHDRGIYKSRTQISVRELGFVCVICVVPRTEPSPREFAPRPMQYALATSSKTTFGQI